MSAEPATLAAARKMLDAAYVVVLRNLSDEEAGRMLLALRDEHIHALDVIEEMKKAVQKTSADILALLPDAPQPQSLKAVE